MTPEQCGKAFADWFIHHCAGWDGRAVRRPCELAFLAGVATTDEELRAIVAKLPVTRDGVIVTPNTSIWGFNRDGKLEQYFITAIRADGVCDDMAGEPHVAEHCYSTGEAAEDAEDPVAVNQQSPALPAKEKK